MLGRCQGYRRSNSDLGGCRGNYHGQLPQATQDGEAIQGALTHTKESTTLRYLRRGRSKQIGLVADARSTKRATETDGGTA